MFWILAIINIECFCLITLAGRVREKEKYEYNHSSQPVPTADTHSRPSKVLSTEEAEKKQGIWFGDKCYIAIIILKLESFRFLSVCLFS